MKRCSVAGSHFLLPLKRLSQSLSWSRTWFIAVGQKIIIHFNFSSLIVVLLNLAQHSTEAYPGKLHCPYLFLYLYRKCFNTWTLQGDEQHAALPNKAFLIAAFQSCSVISQKSAEQGQVTRLHISKVLYIKQFRPDIILEQQGENKTKNQPEWIPGWVNDD